MDGVVALLLVARPFAPISFVSSNPPFASLKMIAIIARILDAASTTGEGEGEGVGVTTSRLPASRSSVPKLPLLLSSQATVARTQSERGARKTSERRIHGG